MNKILPNSIELEQSIISGMLLNPETAETVFQILTTADFYKTGHQVAIDTIHRLYQAGEPCDLPSTVLALNEAGNLEKAGGSRYLSELTDTCPIPSSVEHYCKKVSDLSTRRRLISAGNKIMQQAQKPGVGQEDILEYSQRVIADAMASSPEMQGACRRFKLQNLGAVSIIIADFIIKHLLEADTLFSIFGDPESCKSLFAIAMAGCIATGTDFYGLPIKQGPVIYICGEGQNGIRRRFKAWEIANHISLDDAPIFLSTHPIGLCDNGEIDVVLNEIETVAEQAGPPALIIVDTLARNFGSGDENSTADMTRAIAAADRIRQLYQSSVGLVHHSGISDKNRGRGNSALKGALDAEYKMTKDIDGVIRMEVTKMKDASYPEPMAFKLSVVELGIQDDDGDDVTSVVLRQVGYEPAAAPKSNAGRGTNQQLCLAILKQLFTDHRNNIEQSGRNPDSARVLFNDWRASCIDEGMTRTAFWKTKESLLKIGAIKISGEYVAVS